MGSSAPPVNFPYDEVKLRITIIEDLSSQLISSVLNVQKKLIADFSKTDSDEKKIFEKADSVIEELILKHIKNRFPKDNLLSESSGETIGSSDFTWVIDPLDGTINFVRGIPLFCTSIGIRFRGSNVGGVVIVHSTRDIYVSILGRGAYKNKLKIKTSNVLYIEKALLTPSFPFNRKAIISEVISDLSAFILAGRSLRRTGSLILDLCWIAEGRLDGLWEKDVDEWDVSAASIILHEAGGNLTSLIGKSIETHTNSIIASNGYIHDQIVNILNRTGKGSSMN